MLALVPSPAGGGASTRRLSRADHRRTRWSLLLTSAILVAASACSSPTTPPPSGSTRSPAGPGETSAPTPSTPEITEPSFREFAVPEGAHPHDVAPAADGRVWYTAQRSGELGLLDPATGRTRHIPLGPGSAPHGVIVGPDRAAWVTDGGLNAILRVDAESLKVSRFHLARPQSVNLNTATFDGRGNLWFTGQSGVYGRVDPSRGAVQVFDAPRGPGPYGIATTPDGTAWLASLAGSYIARIDPSNGQLEVIDVPTDGGGARRVWSDSAGRLWVTEWFAGKLARYDPSDRSWGEWGLPGRNPQPYAVFVDDEDVVWVTDLGANALVRFDPERERFRTFSFPTSGAEVRQLLGRPGEVWGAESGTDKLVVLLTS